MSDHTDSFPAVAGTDALLAAKAARIAALRARLDIACEIIANHLDGGSTDRARAMVEVEYRRRNGIAGEPAP